MGSVKGVRGVIQHNYELCVCSVMVYYFLFGVFLSYICKVLFLGFLQFKGNFLMVKITQNSLTEFLYLC